ncbi:MAG: Cof-type HAD-IIB family hydrolase [Cyanobacteria bacterium P01_E01_bin.48]
MGRNIGLIVLDIDGTIAGENNTVAPTVRQAVAAAKAKGIRVAIATGRMYRSACRFHYDIEANMPLAAYQGALVKDPDSDLVHRHWSLPLDIARQLIRQLETTDFVVHVYVDDNLYLKEHNPLSQAYAERSQVPINLLADLGAELSLEPTKILAMAADPEPIDRLLATARDQFPPERLYLTKSVPTFFEATHPEVNKGRAVQYFAEEMLGLTADNVLCVGDSHNDLEMLDYAGIGVAMGNAALDVQARANWIAPSIDAHGVAAAIEEFAL